MALKFDEIPTQDEHIHVYVAAVGPLKCNCTIIINSIINEAIIIDPGGDAKALLATLMSQKVTLKAVYHTHAHFDHFMASEALRKETGAPLFLHKADRFLWDNLEMQCARFGMPAPTTKTEAPDGILQDNQPLELEGLGKHQTLFTPGHTPGSCCFHLEDQGILVAGDTLFRGGIGRTDLWGGDHATITKSLRNRLYPLDGDTVVVTGHGPMTQMHREAGLV